MAYRRIASLKTYGDFSDYLREIDVQLPCDEELSSPQDSPLAQPLSAGGRAIGNRFCILPMEGWDGTSDGKPTELTTRRWRNFGISGAKLIWGGEAVAVRHDGRANPNQLVINESNLGELAGLRQTLLDAHEERFGDSSDLMIGLQLTHSGRFARPNDKSRMEPRPAQANIALDTKQGITGQDLILSDDELRRLIDDFVSAAKLAEKAGFEFVDVKHCHGYLGHELLASYDRPGDFGGSFENRTRFMREIVAGVRATTELQVGTRISIFDFVPFQPDESGTGVPAPLGDPRLAFGADASGQAVDLAEPLQLMQLLDELEIPLVCTTAGSPYYNPHIQRPAYFPPSDGYQPPEDPLVGVQRQVEATAALKASFPRLAFVGSGYSYLQEWLPNVAQAVLRQNMADSIGLGRMVLSYPELPADVLSGERPQRKLICRTFSDCTTAPRNGMVSGCYPLDAFYKKRPEREAMQALKSQRGPLSSN